MHAFPLPGRAEPVHYVALEKRGSLVTTHTRLGLTVYLHGVQGTEGVGKVPEGMFLLEEVPQLARLLPTDTVIQTRWGGRAQLSHVSKDRKFFNFETLDAKPNCAWRRAKDKLRRLSI